MKILYRGKTTYQNPFVTSIKPTVDNIIALANCGKARWKIENESFNILKNDGYYAEHYFGHGRQGLSNLLLTLNLIADPSGSQQYQGFRDSATLSET